MPASTRQSNESNSKQNERGENGDKMMPLSDAARLNHDFNTIKSLVMDYKALYLALNPIIQERKEETYSCHENKCYNKKYYTFDARYFSPTHTNPFFTVSLLSELDSLNETIDSFIEQDKAWKESKCGKGSQKSFDDFAEQNRHQPHKSYLTTSEYKKILSYQFQALQYSLPDKRELGLYNKRVNKVFQPSPIKRGLYKITKKYGTFLGIKKPLFAEEVEGYEKKNNAIQTFFTNGNKKTKFFREKGYSQALYPKRYENESIEELVGHVRARFTKPFLTCKL